MITMNNTYTRETYMNAYHDLLCCVSAAGYPEEFGKVIAGQLHSERAIRRMIAYLEKAHPKCAEEIADEMLAIMEDRNTWAKKKEAQESNRRYSVWLNDEMRNRDD